CARRHSENQARHDERGGRVDKKRRRLLVRDVLGYGHHAEGRYDDLLLPVPACFIEHGYALAEPQPTQKTAPRLHDADSLDSRRGGQLRPVTVLAANREEVRRTYRTEQHAHAHLTGSWLGFGHLADLQDFRRIAELFKNHRFHGCSFPFAITDKG